MQFVGTDPLCHVSRVEIEAPRLWLFAVTFAKAKPTSAGSGASMTAALNILACMRSSWGWRARGKIFFEVTTWDARTRRPTTTGSVVVSDKI